MRTRLLAVAAILLVAALLGAACDGGGDGDNTTDVTGADGTPGDITLENYTPPSTDEMGLPVYPAAPALADAGDSSGRVSLQWWGQAMFAINSPQGTDVLIDPYGEGIGYRVPQPGEAGQVSIATVSHDHPDHNNVESVGHNILLRGLTDDGWAQIDEQPTGDVRFRSVPSWHDESEGADRGRNAIFVFETGGLPIVHLGDLGHALTQAQIDAIGPVDVLLVPVGGFFTIDAAGATEVVEQLGPRVVIPMHYKTDTSTISQLRPVQPFLAQKEVEEKGSRVDLRVDDLPARGSAVVWVLEPEGATD